MALSVIKRKLLTQKLGHLLKGVAFLAITWASTSWKLPLQMAYPSSWGIYVNNYTISGRAGRARF